MSTALRDPGSPPLVRVVAGDTNDPHAVRRINLSWLLRLRWAVVGGKAVLIGIVDRGMDIELPLAPLAALLFVEAVTNVACMVWLRRAARVGEGVLGGLMVLDVCLFTGLLYFTGGPFNPFSFFYLVYIALAALILPPRWTWALVLLSLACSAGLFLHHVPLPVDHGAEHAHHHHGGAHAAHESMSMHLRGMWIAFGLAAAFIVYFLHRVTRSLADRELELAAARERTARHERLAAVATLAAGAAHELATPLSTIAVVAKELERSRSADAVTRDARLIREEVGRCRDILSRLSDEAGQTVGELAVPVTVEELIDAVVSALPEVERQRVLWTDRTKAGQSARSAATANEAGQSARRAATANETRGLVVPVNAFSQALRGVVKNALDASQGGDKVEVTVERSASEWIFAVVDRGCGMSPSVRARATEPFFTTKEPGHGMGLGLFLAQSVLDLLGGRLDIDSTLGKGTRATLVLPQAVPAHSDGGQPA